LTTLISLASRAILLKDEVAALHANVRSGHFTGERSIENIAARLENVTALLHDVTKEGRQTVVSVPPLSDTREAMCDHSGGATPFLLDVVMKSPRLQPVAQPIADTCRTKAHRLNKDRRADAERGCQPD
jgi:hypothetical protein